MGHCPLWADQEHLCTQQSVVFACQRAIRLSSWEAEKRERLGAARTPNQREEIIAERRALYRKALPEHGGAGKEKAASVKPPVGDLLNRNRRLGLRQVQCEQHRLR